MDRVYDDVLYRHDNCSFDPFGRDYAIDEFADLASNNGEPVYFRLQEDHVGSIAIGFLGCVSGLVLSYFLNVPSGAFIILFLVVPFGLESNKTVVTALIKE